MCVLVVDIGGTHVKMLATGQREPRELSSRPTLTAEEMVGGGNVHQLETLPMGCRAGDNAKRVRRLDLGKVLAQRIIPELESRRERGLTHDSSTNALIRRHRMRKGGGR